MARLAYSYARVSSDSQTDGDGLDRQAAAFLPFCERHGLQPVPDRLLDAGVSAFRGKNRRMGNLGRFLSHARDGRVPEGSVLVLEDLDRFSREAASHAERLLLDLFDAGLALGVVRDDVVVDRAAYDSDLAIRLQFLVRRDAAHDYSVKLSGRLASAWSAEVERSLTGRKIRKLCPFWCDWDAAAGDFVLNEHVEVVRRMVRMSCEGIGAPRIAQELNAEGLVTASSRAGKGGKPWTRGYVSKVLLDRKLIGESTVKRQGQPDLILPGYLPAAVTLGEFEQSLTAMRSRHGNFGRVGRGCKVRNILQGMIFCSCGAPLSFFLRPASRGDKRAFLRCTRYADGLCTIRPRSVPYDEDALLLGLASERWRDYFNRPADNRKRRDLERKLREAERLQAEATGKAERARQNLADLLGNGLDVGTARRLSAAADAADAAERESAQGAALLRAELLSLEGRDGRDLEVEIRRRVDEFLTVGRHDPAERSRFNSWLMLQGFRVELVDAARRRFRYGTVELLGRNPLDGEVEVYDTAGGVIWQTPVGRDYWEARAEALREAAGG